MAPQMRGGDTCARAQRVHLLAPRLTCSHGLQPLALMLAHAVKHRTHTKSLHTPTLALSTC
eukprot:3573853-Pyramimonas_sp.AAC.1